MASGIGPLGILAGSSTAARSAARLPSRKAASSFLNFSYSARESTSHLIARRGPKVKCPSHYRLKDSLYSFARVPPSDDPVNGGRRKQ